MKVLVILLTILLALAATSNIKTVKLTDQLASVKSGSVKFTAEVVTSSNNEVTLKNLSTGEMIKASAPNRIFGKQGNVTLSLNNGYPLVVGWAALNTDGAPIGTITAVSDSGVYVEVNSRWYRLYDIKALRANERQLIGRQAYANGDRVDRVDI
jgi:hypothetical protein